MLEEEEPPTAPQPRVRAGKRQVVAPMPPRAEGVFTSTRLAGTAAALWVTDVLLSSLLGVFAFSSFWSIKEVFEQRERVRKGWFPANPRRKSKLKQEHKI